MKQSEAVDHLRLYIFTLQKFRSNTAGELPFLTDSFKGNLSPWVFGDKCPLDALVKAVDACDAGGRLEPQSYYNFMYIANSFSPEIVIASSFYAKYEGKDGLPGIPPVTLVANGWDDE